MANNYLHRIEALEAAITPRHEHIVILRDGDDKEAAIQRECAAKGLRRDDPHLTIHLVTFVKSPFAATDAC